MNEHLVSVVAGAFLGGIISSLSFYYKSRIEVRAKVNTAIFHLLEVWSVLGMVKTLQSKEFSTKLVQRLKYKLPRENLGSDPERDIIKGMEKLLPFIVDSQLSGQHFLEKYTNAVVELAPIYPIQAYQLNKNQLLIKYLDGIDALMTEHKATDTDEAFLQSFRSFASQDAMNEFEKDLRGLAKRSRIFGFSELNNYIDSLKNRVNDLPSEVFDQMIEQILCPVVQEHYDRTGLENPNTL